MQRLGNKILIWLPSPLGDAVLCTTAIRSLVLANKDCEFVFLASKAIKDILTPNTFSDKWLIADKNLIKNIRAVKKLKFDCAVIFKNSFKSALTVFLAGIPIRIGYSRQGRGMLLTEKLYAPKLDNGCYKPSSMIDYYLAIAGWCGGSVANREMELSISKDDTQTVCSRIDMLNNDKILKIILVPGGAFGPSKCWHWQRYGETAKLLIEKYNAAVMICAAPNEMEIAEKICQFCDNKTVNLARYNFSLSQLKAVFGKAELVITNDTGPRHIAIALKKKVITLFGPNDPQWTQTGYANELQIIGKAQCVPCAKKKCYQPEHICMDSITVDDVMQAVRKIL